MDYGAAHLTEDEKAVANRRLDFITEDARAMDVDQLEPTTLFYINLAELSYRWPYGDYDWIRRRENAFLHSADPASAVAFPSTDGVELHWRLDERFDDPETEVVESPIDSFYLYRSGGGPPTYTLLTPDPLHGLSWVDSTASPANTYVYLVESAEGDSGLGFSDEIIMDYAGPSSEPAFWLIGWWLDDPVADSIAVHIEVGAYPGTTAISA